MSHSCIIAQPRGERKMSKTKPPKLDINICEDKRESVELWLEQFDDWCMLQGFRDPKKDPRTSFDHWKKDHHAEEISAFRLALPIDMLKMVKSTVVPNMQTQKSEDDAVANQTYIGFPWVWEKMLAGQFCGQDTVLANRMIFLETCKQKEQESIGEFESRCKHIGLKCEYGKMTDPEGELIRDRFVTGIRDDKLRAELLRHKKDDGSVVTLTEVVNKAKAWESAYKTNIHVIEKQRTEEQVNYTNVRRNTNQTQKQSSAKPSPTCGYCGAPEKHNQRTCPAAKPGVKCAKC